MKTRAILAVAGLAAFAGAANAQITQNATVAYTLTWQDTGNNNGVLETGESAIVRLTATMTPAVGTVISEGTLKGIASGFIDVNSTNLNGANWSGLTVDATWDLVGATGTVVGGGNELQNIQFGQFPFSLNTINPMNPIVNVWTGTFTPTSFASRTATLTVEAGAASGGNAASVLIQTGTPNPSSFGTFQSQVNFGSVQIPIIPAPSSLALLGLGGLVAGRRRR